jgi:hypothetical protein
LFFQVIKQYPDIVKDIRIEKFRQFGFSYQLRALVFLCDDSELYVKDYLFQDNSRKYSYHWQSKDGKLIGRWDNAPHWPDAGTFPHHFHNGQTGNIDNSEIRNMEGVFKHIRMLLSGKDHG